MQECDPRIWPAYVRLRTPPEFEGPDTDLTELAAEWIAVADRAQGTADLIGADNPAREFLAASAVLIHDWVGKWTAGPGPHPLPDPVQHDVLVQLVMDNAAGIAELEHARPVRHTFRDDSGQIVTREEHRSEEQR
jgi:hypothetical protein